MTLSPLATPRSVDIALTGRCNLACRYCFYADEMTARSDLSTAEWLLAFDQFERLGVMDVCLSGGEAFTRPDFFELVDGLIERKMRYSILSNGTLVTKALLDRFEDGKRGLRLNSIQVSIDGATAEVHDRSRPGSFDRALRGLRLLKERGFPVTVRVTVSRHNLHDIENVARLLLDDVGLSSFSTNDAFPMGAGCRGQEDVSLTPLEQLEAMKLWGRVLEKWPGRVTALAGSIALGQMYAEIELARLTGKKTTRWGMGRLTACGCIFNKISILHDGGVVPCTVLPKLVMGNIRQDDLSAIWSAHPTLVALRERRGISLADVPGCGGCEWGDLCNGNCPAMAFEASGDLNRADEATCYRTFLAATEARPSADV